MKTQLVNKRQVREFALSVAQQRYHKFSRVGGEFFVKCEAVLRSYIASHVAGLPSKGKTIL